MSKEKDTDIIISIKKQLILNNTSVEFCKECIHFNVASIVCNNPYNNNKCNLLEIFFIGS